MTVTQKGDESVPVEAFDPPWPRRLHQGIEWIVRFAEIILLTAAFQYAAIKTGNAMIFGVAALLMLGTLLYAAQLLRYLSAPLLKRPRSKGWLWLPLAALGCLGWAFSNMVQSLIQAVNLLTNAQPS